MEHYFVYQMNEDACSLAALEMLLVNEGRDPRLKRLKLASHPPHSLKDLEEGALHYGYKLSFYRNEEGEISYPFGKRRGFLALMGQKEHAHMVYVKKIEGEKVIYYDPANGKMRLGKTEFARGFSGIFGVLEGTKAKERVKRRRFLNPFIVFLLALLSTLSGLSLLAGFYFFYEEGNLLYPILSFIAFGLFSLSERLLAMRSCRALDEKYLYRTYSEDKGRFVSIYRHYHEYKRYLLSEAPRAIAASIECLLLLILVSSNNPFFLLSVGLSVVVYFLLSHPRKGRMRKKRAELERLEDSLHKDEEKENCLLTLKEISNLSLSFARDIEYGRIVMGVTLLSSSLLSLLGQNEITLNYYLFHLFSLIAVSSLGRKAIDVLESKKERDEARGECYEYLLD